MNASRFADEIGLQRSNVSHVLSGRNKPSLDFIMRILDRFNDVNADWLLFGKGNYGKGKEDLFSGNADDKAEYPARDKKADEIDRQKDPISPQPEGRELPGSTEKTGIKKVLVLFKDGSYEEISTNN